jgi:phenylpropionate dioxygenase-like ring-hydroxylating dioxygenase large terminal subunit
MSTSPFLRNVWYVAAWSHEVGPDQLFQRTILGQSLLFFRTSLGKVVALDNKCCHRHAPLSQGRREGDCVRCMYHGLKFGADGRCIEIPGQTAIPSSVRVKTFPIMETKRWIWVWLGDPAMADATAIPEMFSLEHPQWRMKPGYMHYKANHLLISDNILDFSHLSYVHEKTLGGSTAIAGTRPKTERLERGVRLTREIKGSVPAPNHIKLGAPTGPVDRWWIYDYLIPGILLLDSGVKASNPGEGGGRTLNFHSCQAITPETERSTHYFFMQAHGFSLEDPTITDSLYAGVIAAFDEDQRIVEAQQQLIDSTPPAEMIGLIADTALAHFREVYQRALDEEAGANAHGATAGFDKSVASLS